MANQLGRTFTNDAVTTTVEILNVKKLPGETSTGSDTRGKCFAVRVKNTGATNDLLVQVPAVHGTEDWDELAPDEEQLYVDAQGDISQVKVKSETSTTAYRAAVVKS